MRAILDSFRSNRRLRRVAPLAGIVLINVAVWGPTIRYDFVFDDLVNVVANDWIRSLSALPAAFASHAAGFNRQFDTSFYRPFMHVVYAVTYAAAGMRPWAYHLVNVVFQVAAAIAVYRLSDALCRRWVDSARCAWLSLVAALVFSVHPVHTEAVAWIAGITDLSSATFGLLALIAYVHAFERRTSPWPGVLLLASLLSKETGGVFVLLMLVLEWIEAGRDRAWSPAAAARRLAAPVLGVCVYAGMRLAALGSFAPSATQHPHSVPELVAAAAGLFARYLGVLVWPVDLNVMRIVPLDRGFADPAAAAGLVLACALAVLARRWRRVPFVSLSIAVVVLPILPTLYVPAIESGSSVFGERYLYLPVLGMAWGIGFVASLAARKTGWTRGAAAGSVALLLSVCVSLSLARSPAWASSLSLWTDAARKSPHSAAAHEGLCFALYDTGRIPEALSACERSIAIDPARVDARINRANALLALRRPEAALREADEVVARRFNSAEAHTVRGLALMALGRADEALAAYRQALVIDPEHAEAHNDLGVALVHLGRPDEARTHFDRAVRAAPGNPEYVWNLRACP